MANRDVKKKVISKWVKSPSYAPDAKLQQVVYTQVEGKNRKGKEVRSSITRHERIS